MPTRVQFDYSVVRVVPRVERDEFINVGVILFCRSRRFLVANFEPDWTRLQTFAPALDMADIQAHFELFSQVCVGGSGAGYIGQLSQSERFHWLVAPRSTIIQTSPAHSGLCVEPAATLEHLLATLVRL